MRQLDNPFAGERAIIVQNNALTDINAIRGLFARTEIRRDPADVMQFIQKGGAADARIVFSNPYSTQQIKALHDTCRANSQPILVMERGGLPGTMLFDTNGFLSDSTAYRAEFWHPKNLTSRQHKRLVSSGSAAIARYHREKTYLEPQPTEARAVSKDAEDKLRVFVALQVRTDTVTGDAYSTAAGHIDYDTFLGICEQFAADNAQDIDLHYKPHPLDGSLRLRGARLEDGNIDDLIAAADLILTYNSGVGLLSYMHDKPVITAGRAYYAGHDLCTEVYDLESLKNAIERRKENFSPIARRTFLGHLTENLASEVRFHTGRFRGTTRLKSVEPKHVLIWGEDGTLFDRRISSARSHSSTLRPIIRWARNRLADLSSGI